MKVKRSLPLAAEEFTTVSHNAVKKSHIRSLSLSLRSDEGASVLISRCLSP